jgi:hypothetical protein
MPVQRSCASRTRGCVDSPHRLSAPGVRVIVVPSRTLAARHGDNCGVFQPSQHDVRRFFCGAWRKQRDATPLSALETLASLWIAEHPEYHAEMVDEEAALAADYAVDAGRTNPFLHLSMHLSLSEQCSIDQPPGIRAAVELLAERLGSLHDAHHQAMECLGEMIWQSQRSGTPPDGAAYIECVRRRATA